MKALNISDDVKVTEKISSSLKKLGYDNINYKWFVKALDNLEEVDPDLISINVSEYPRHWKMLAQFEKTFGKNVKIVLLIDSPLKEDDEEKAVFYNAVILNVNEDFDAQLSVLTESAETVEIDVESENSVSNVSEKEAVETPVSEGGSSVKASEPETAVSETKSESKHFGSLLKRISSEYEK